MNLAAPESLTGREREVLMLMFLGCTAKESAIRMGRISPRTVDAYRAEVLRKYGFQSTKKLLAYFFGKGEQ